MTGTDRRIEVAEGASEVRIRLSTAWAVGADAGTDNAYEGVQMCKAFMEVA